MTGTEMFDAIAHIDEDLIEGCLARMKARSSERRTPAVAAEAAGNGKKPISAFGRSAIAIAAAAAAVVLMLVIISVLHIGGESPEPITPVSSMTPTPTETEAPSPSPEPDVTEAHSEGEVLIFSSTYLGSAIKVTPDISTAGSWYVDEDKVGETKTVEFLGNTYELEYECTETRVLYNDSAFDSYFIIGINGKTTDRSMGSVELLPDGTIYHLSFNSEAAIKVEKCGDKEAARAAAEKALGAEIDFSRFGFCEASETDPEHGYHSYVITWSNKIGDIGTNDCVRVSVMDGAEITQITMGYRLDLGINEAPDDLSLETYLPRIEAKLDELLGDALTGYELSSVNLTRVNGELCISCWAAVTFNAEDGEHHGDCHMAVFLDK